MEVPFTPYEVDYYDVVVVYFSADYNGTTDYNRFEYVYVDADGNRINKRDTVTTVYIYIYPTAEDLFDADCELGAFVAKSVSSDEIDERKVYKLDITDIALADDATYMVMMRGCDPDDEDSCIYGSPTEYSMKKDATDHNSGCLCPYCHH